MGRQSDDHGDWDANPLDSVAIQKLRVFKTVAEIGHFSRAAEYLNITQPVVSGHIRKLEEKVGAQLFRRAGRGVTLTEAGTRVLAWASDVLVESSALESDLQKIQTGRMGKTTISSSPSVGSYALAKVLTDFARVNVDARIGLEITHPSASTNAVRSGRCDFAVSLLDPSQPTDDLTVEILWYERYLLVCSVDSEWAGKELELADLSEIPLITGNSGAVRRSIEDDKLLELGVTKRNIVLEFGHPEPVKQAALQGFGCAFMFETTAVRELEEGRLLEVTIPQLNLRNPIFLAVRKRKVLTPLEIKLIEYLRDADIPGTTRPPKKMQRR